MIFFIRSFIADFDGKIQKYFSALKTANIQFHYVGWSRGNVTKTNNKDDLLDLLVYLPMVHLKYQNEIGRLINQTIDDGSHLALVPTEANCSF